MDDESGDYDKRGDQERDDPNDGSSDDDTDSELIPP